MPAAVAKGILISISIIAALGLAVAENPQVQQWLEEQRCKIAELLRQIGEELDPQSRREAEAFAYEGRTVANDDSLRREASGSREAAEVATGRSLSNASTVRRIPISGPRDPNEAEERRRKGREYLAQRNQQLYELQQRRNTEAKAEVAEDPPSPTFDELVDVEGKLKAPASAPLASSELPTVDSLPLLVQEDMKEVERQLSQPLLADPASYASSSGWQSGSAFANPFSDEYALERSITQKPPIPPKISLSRAPTPPISVPGSFEDAESQEPQQPAVDDELTYEEQLAIAISLSEQENAAKTAATLRPQVEDDDNDLKTAIAASLKDMDYQQAAHAVANTHFASRRPTAVSTKPLVDLTPVEPMVIRPSQRDWATFFNQPFAMSHELHSLSPPSVAPSETSDELYRLTPQLTSARLANLNAQHAPLQAQPPNPSANSNLPFDPVREAAREPQRLPEAMDASFHSALASPRRRSVTLDREEPQLIDIGGDDAADGARTPKSHAHSSFGFQTDSDTDTFASVSKPASRAHSRARSDLSNVEVVDLVEDSDVDMLSEEGDGIATPDSWSEVGSRDADSEVDDDYFQHSSHVAL